MSLRGMDTLPDDTNNDCQTNLNERTSAAKETVGILLQMYPARYITDMHHVYFFNEFNE